MSEQVISYVEGEKGLIEVILGTKKKSKTKSPIIQNRQKKKISKGKRIVKIKK